jgi:hypothetical protein
MNPRILRWHQVQAQLWVTGGDVGDVVGPQQTTGLQRFPPVPNLQKALWVGFRPRKLPHTCFDPRATEMQEPAQQL